MCDCVIDLHWYVICCKIMLSTLCRSCCRLHVFGLYRLVLDFHLVLQDMYRKRGKKQEAFGPHLGTRMSDRYQNRSVWVLQACRRFLHLQDTGKLQNKEAWKACANTQEENKECCQPYSTLWKVLSRGGCSFHLWYMNEQHKHPNTNMLCNNVLTLTTSTNIVESNKSPWRLMGKLIHHCYIQT